MSVIKTKAAFQKYVQSVEARTGYRRPLAFAVGIAHMNREHTILDTIFPLPQYEDSYGTAAVFADVVGHVSGTATYVLTREALLSILDKFSSFMNDGEVHENIDVIKRMASACKGFVDYDINKVVVVSFIDVPDHDLGPQTVSDAFLRLHLLSLRKVVPNGINLDNIFGVLRNNAWTNEGPIDIDELAERQLSASIQGRLLHVNSVDRFPRMTDYVIPSGIRIADASRVRLGAYVGEGTVVMHEGFINFNAGTLGISMIEGRISAGVTVGDQTDIGGGASITGILSGGGTEKIIIGRGCLMGANSGTGISLGDRCVIESGFYVTPGMKLIYRSKEIKAIELSGSSGITFWRNGLTGTVEALDRPNSVVLNTVLHQN